MADLTPEQKSVIRRALAVAKRKGASPREQKALVEALAVESNFRVLNYGDRDSVGALQQRPSQGWGPAGEPLEKDVSQFLAAARKANTGRGSAGELAQAVQRSAFPARYGAQSGLANQILSQYGGAASSGGSRTVPGFSVQTVTNPGVDNSALRRQLVGDFLAQGGVKNTNAVLGLAAQYGQAADTPASTSTIRVPGSTRPSPSTRTSGSKAKHGSEVLELIYNDGGKGYGIKNGQTVNGPQVYQAVWAGHANHVHVAAGPKTTVALGKLAERMGLHVGENPHFGGVDPVHVPGSYHYKGEAVDVSGDPKKMAAFARAVQRYNRNRRLPK